MYARNPNMLAQGFGPAAEVARRLSKSVSTVHRLVASSTSGITIARDRRALYIDLESLRAYFDRSGNEVLAALCRDMRTEMIQEGASKLHAAPPQEG